MKKHWLFLLLATLSLTQLCTAQTWVDTMDRYAREKFLPPSHYSWNWQNSALLNTMVKEYDQSSPAQQQYLDYVRRAMDKTYSTANGKTPNAVASALGLAFLYRVTKEEKYKRKAEKVYQDYLKIRRTSEGGVSHLMLFTELWDDTVFMIGQYLLGMYRATGDEQYLEELVKQIRIHHDKLHDTQWGLWVHGWDSDDKVHCSFCSQMHWPDKQTRRSAELWGRGNGWIVVTLSDVLETVPRTNPHWNELAGYLREMLAHLPELQDKKTGHWYQLPARNTDPNNFIESSCTAMFGYGICTAIKLGLVSDVNYRESAALAYQGLREYSTAPAGDGYLTPTHVCTGTCIGDKDYYLKRAVQKGRPFGVGMYIQFGRKFEEMVNKE
jgi:unsaturated rhamnogalacturonyl hydrolase